MAALALLCALGAGSAQAEALSAQASSKLAWAMKSGDNAGKPFAIVDKKSARLLVFSSTGALLGNSPALLGQAKGDTAAPGIGAATSDVSKIPVSLRTTPAGRFGSQPGKNLKGEHVVWFDYEAGLAIHRLRPAPAQQRREQRLASGDPAQSKISLGCVIVPVAFYTQVVMPALGGPGGAGVVYVLPEA